MTATAAPPLREAERLRRLVLRRLGLRVRREHVPELARILAARSDAIGCADPARYIAERLDADEWRHLASELTVAESYFWRSPPHLDAFRELLRATPADRETRVLSAGCARGEEPYTLAILADLEGRPVQISAFDVDRTSLARAESAEYAQRALRDVPPDVRARYFSPNDARGRQRVDPRIRARVRFEERNLALDDDAFWAPAAFDVVFCRNVLMYLARPVVRRAVDRFARALVPGGILFLGHAETLRGLSDAFRLEQGHGSFYYRKDPHGARVRGPSAPLATPPSAAPTPAAAPPAPAESTDWGAAGEEAHARTPRLAEPKASSTHTRAAASPALDDARRAFEAGDLAHVLALVPTDARGLAGVMRAAALVAHGRLEEARAALETCLADDDLVPEAHALLAFSVGELGDDERALAHERAAMYLDPGFALVRLQHGRRLARRASQASAARRELEQALALLPGEHADRLLVFGGGLSRVALADLARAELRRLERTP